MCNPEPGTKMNYVASAFQGLESFPGISGIPLNCIVKRMVGLARSMSV